MWVILMFIINCPGVNADTFNICIRHTEISWHDVSEYEIIIKKKKKKIHQAVNDKKCISGDWQLRYQNINKNKWQ